MYLLFVRRLNEKMAKTISLAAAARSPAIGQA
jgi:hypothetical protein